MTEPLTLSEKLRTCFDHIDEIEDWYGEEDIRNNLIKSVMEILETHFSVSKLELEMGEVHIKSNNQVIDTAVSIHGKVVPVTHIDWEMDAEDMLGKLRLTFRS
jgi:hypothetical protein